VWAGLRGGKIGGQIFSGWNGLGWGSSDILVGCPQNDKIKERARKAGRVAKRKHLWGGLPLRGCFWQGWAILTLAFHGRQVAIQAADGLGFPFRLMISVVQAYAL
jgi:hypothetical protein